MFEIYLRVLVVGWHCNDCLLTQLILFYYGQTLTNFSDISIDGFGKAEIATA